MTLRFRFVLSVAALALVACVLPEAAHAYGGPGSVISGIGAFLAAVAALLASLFGFIWFPLKRLYKKMTDEEPASSPSSTEGRADE
ncbi:MAG: hypothetical protein ABEK84_06130 [Salinibacter sp.]